MPSLQIRDMPQDVYEVLAERAKRERRSLAQQAIVELSRMPELEAKRRRLAAIEEIRKLPRVLSDDAADPVDLIREDRDSR